MLSPLLPGESAETGQPTRRTLNTRRKPEFIAPIPEPRKRRKFAEFAEPDAVGEDRCWELNSAPRKWKPPAPDLECLIGGKRVLPERDETVASDACWFGPDRQGPVTGGS